MLKDLLQAAHQWWLNLGFLRRLGIRVLGAAAILSMLIALAPKAAAAALGGALAALGANALAYAFGAAS